MKIVGKTVVVRGSKASIEDWPERHTLRDGSTVRYAKAPGSVIVGDVVAPVTFNVGNGKIKIKIG